MTTRIERATRFRALHDPAAPLALANVWDAAGARIVAAAGASAIATTSAGVAWGLGAADGDQVSRDAMLGQLARIVAASGDLPVTADIETGFGTSPADVADTIARVLDTGAVGVNIEDALPAPGASGDPLRPVAEQAERLAAARAAAYRAGIPLYINARIDVFLCGVGEESGRLQATIDRARAYLEAGASGVFILGVRDAETIAALTAGIDAPVNVGGGALSVAQLGKLGVARVSLGAGTALAAYGALDRMARELLGESPSSALDYATLNGLMKG
ncbi:isocitrate lyase/phosphoenolpyruvate mutase family protein [Actinospica sp. MGRD01-02]|uniref:Isocitrate lyase/phosphoenolpyruvate mutase family protein n=1 Tax=Actinospica acidithermotolerans TaxID=2828514 RepID=A0A941IGT6_9ACTN|nr:isocitrate lyase/phosphoenolpyruvate mutase family protein [Actinospica acidithermotolerans]MBR7824997.1 isocitrate lyase/phosphoenolpyruvate mutase family protein [Actinospica acidithermotolerans]